MPHTTPEDLDYDPGMWMPNPLDFEPCPVPCPNPDCPCQYKPKNGDDDA